MYFVKEDYNKLRKSVPITKIVDEFKLSGEKCVKLDDDLYENKERGARGFRNHLYKTNLKYIKVTVQDDSIYLINTLIRG